VPSTPALAEWARANPADRDALLALAERAVALQPAAEAAIQHSRAAASPSTGWAEDARRVQEAYRSLVEHLRALRLGAPVAGQLGELLDRHLEALDRAMARDPDAPEGLGPPAGRLVGLRDLLRRTLAIRGRGVSDVTPGV
jgi:hypothetical protein